MTVTSTSKHTDGSMCVNQQIKFIYTKQWTYKKTIPAATLYTTTMVENLIYRQLPPAYEQG